MVTEARSGTLAISSNNRWLAASGEDRTIRLWDMHNPSAVPKTLKGHGGWVNVIVISPDNRWLVSGSDDGTVRLWDLDALHRKLEPLHGEMGHIRTMVMGPLNEIGNYWLAVGSDNSNIRLWAFTSQGYSEKPTLLRTQAWGTKALAISPKTCRWLVSGHDTGTAFLWDLTKLDFTNKPDSIDRPTDILVGHTTTIRAVAISADDRWLITSSNDWTARIWRLTEQTSSGQPTPLYGHRREISVVAISPDSRWAVTGSGDRTARLWSLPAPDSGYEPQFAKELIGHKNWISALAISADSRWLVTTSRDGTARRWDLTDSNTAPLEMRGHGGQIRTAAIGDKDNHRLFTGGDDGTVHIRDLAGLEDTYPIVLLGRKDNNNEVWTTGISPGNKWLATGHRDGKVRLWKLTEKGVSGDPWILNPKAWGTRTIAFINKNHKDKWLITGHDEGAVYLWDLESLETRNPGFELDFKPSYLLRDHKKIPGKGAILAMAVSSKGHWLITRSKDATARLWDLSKLEPITSPETIEVESTKLYEYKYPAPNPVPNPVLSVAISPQGNWLVIGIEGGIVYLSALTEEGASDRFTLDPLAWGIYAVAISAENNKDKWLITGHADGTIRLWDLEQFATKDPNNETKPQPAFVLQGYAKDFIGERDIQSLAISGNGRWLVTGSKDKTACLWDLSALDPAKQPVPTSILRGHGNAIKTVAISPDCCRVVTGSVDGTVRLWSLTALNQGMQPEDIALGEDCASDVKALAVSPDSRWLVTGCADGTAHLWSLRLDDLRKLACQVVGRNLTQAESVVPSLLR